MNFDFIGQFYDEFQNDVQNFSIFFTIFIMLNTFFWEKKLGK